jgi:ABC-type Mn2+/Zn2+ transport system permease subunit
MAWLKEPFEPEFMQRALAAGLLVVVLCSVIGTWVVLRGLAFIGDALAHGVVPGIALGFVLGFNVTLGAALAAVVIVLGVSLVSRRTDLREDTGIGLLFVGMLALGVIIISREGSFSSELTSFLFGNVLAINDTDLTVLVVSVVVALLASVVLYRPFLVLAFDERKAATLGLRPGLTRVVLLALVALSVVASFSAVGSLLVFGLLVAPPATASLVVRRVPLLMVAAAGFGALAVVAGLLLSWYLDVAAGASMAACSVAEFFVVLAGRDLVRALARSPEPEASRLH